MLKNNKITTLWFVYFESKKSIENDNVFSIKNFIDWLRKSDVENIVKIEFKFIKKENYIFEINVSIWKNNNKKIEKTFFDEGKKNYDQFTNYKKELFFWLYALIIINDKHYFEIDYKNNNFIFEFKNKELVFLINNKNFLKNFLKKYLDKQEHVYNLMQKDNIFEDEQKILKILSNIYLPYAKNIIVTFFFQIFPKEQKKITFFYSKQYDKVGLGRTHVVSFYKYADINNFIDSEIIKKIKENSINSIKFEIVPKRNENFKKFHFSLNSKTIINENEFIFLKNTLEEDDTYEQKKFDSKIQNIFELIFSKKSNILTFPIFQRPYVWTKEIFSKILDSFEKFNFLKESNDKNNYSFLNQIILRKKFGNEVEVIDGQQRIISILIIIVAIIDFGIHKQLHDNEKNNFEFIDPIKKILENIEKKIIKEKEDEEFLIFKSELFSEKIQYKANDLTQKYLNKLMTFSSLPKIQQNKEENFIYNNYIYALDWLNDKIKNNLHFWNLQNNLISKVIFSSLYVEDQKNDFFQYFFEIMNTTSQKLTIFDLFKNYLLQVLTKNNENSKIINKIQSFLKKFSKLILNGDKTTIIPDVKLKSFIKLITFGSGDYELKKLWKNRKYLSLFEILKNYFEYHYDENNKEKILNHFLNKAEIYSYLNYMHYDNEIIVKKFLEFKYHIYFLSKNDVTHPLIYNIINSLDEKPEKLSEQYKIIDSRKKTERILNAICEYQLKMFLIHNQGQSFTTFYDSLINELDKEKTQDIVEWMYNTERTRRVMPSDEELMNSLKNKKNLEKINNNAFIIKILFLVNLYIKNNNKNWSKLRDVNFPDKDSSLEHFVAKKNNDNSEFNDFKYTLGNLLIVTKDWNSLLSNKNIESKRKEFAEKKEQYLISHNLYNGFDSKNINLDLIKTKEEFEERNYQINNIIKELFKNN
ncbi:DUF262 domain-containing protein [Mesomycoplasma neurolyticum]|uniref:Protein of uncharacterized function DUF262 n=1 Tax=Mesomycoplasma neurolyticum TaxID=2120 RepID=A0A449A544_9BACT|nr:DUF262 domain-containing protein [Mesomycoplasma neurolyticum]VEU59356.1 Protein of uncharacterised function DUF262 [Mesomycoplasma neurolyticum]